MRYSKVFPKPRREDPREANSPGTRLLIRAGFIHKTAAGIWSWTPLGLRVRRKVEQIVREEMDRTGAVEIELPILQAREFWDETQRWDKYQRADISFCLRDRTGAEFMLAPTAEELVTEYARSYLRSHRDLPVAVWQMSPKFRDELRPRQGLVRGREFVMKDAYSFGANREQMEAAYRAMSVAYGHVFSRCGFDPFLRVEADSGAIGGSGSAEFMAVTEFGEDVLLHCPSCNYGANQEKATTVFSYDTEDEAAFRRIDTPNIRTVEELEGFVGIPAGKMVKTIVLVADNHPVIVSMRGDLQISEVKLANLLKAETVDTASNEVVVEITKAPVGFAGPIGLFNRERVWNGKPVQYLFDRSVEGLKNFLCGGNEVDVHYVNVNKGRDFPAPETYYDLSKVEAGHACPRCNTKLEMAQGIELGHIFQLQTVYSEPMSATFTDENGGQQPYWMGCYGIGVSRIVQAIVEQSYDERGPLWPIALAPYQMVIIPATPNHMEDAKRVYDALRDIFGDEVMLDDRGERFGAAMTDAEFVGYPIQLVMGRAWTSGEELEVRLRDQRHHTSDAKKPPVNMKLEDFIGWWKHQLVNGNGNQDIS